jgi:CheY-like chemotaxis protein
MSLILAVEPDRKQAKQLSSVVRQHVKAEFVVADSGSAALAALGNRIPDLILTPALLPPKDEAVLTGWLRDLGDAAAHVQTLAIPILAEPSSRKDKDPGVSIFGRLRDQGPADSGPGCDPSVFADQIRVYLDRVDSDRSTRVTASGAAQTVDLPSEVSIVAAASDEQVPDMEPFDEAVTFDDLVFDPSPRPRPYPSRSRRWSCAHRRHLPGRTSESSRRCCGHGNRSSGWTRRRRHRRCGGPRPTR